MTEPRTEPRPSLTLVPASPAGRLSTATEQAPSDAPVLARIAGGDERAVAACVARYSALVWSLARRGSSSAEDAEDAVQEIFVDLWRTASRFDPARASEAGWVAMIARRRLIDRMRKRNRLPELEPIPLGFDVADERGRDLDRESQAEHARAVLATLPAAQRRALELSLVDGKTHDEIARETATPLGTVKSHIRRGLQRVRELMAESPAPNTTSDGGRGPAR